MAYFRGGLRRRHGFAVVYNETTGFCGGGGPHHRTDYVYNLRSRTDSGRGSHLMHMPNGRRLSGWRNNSPPIIREAMKPDRVTGAVPWRLELVRILRRGRVWGHRKRERSGIYDGPAMRLLLHFNTEGSSVSPKGITYRLPLRIELLKEPVGSRSNTLRVWRYY